MPPTIGGLLSVADTSAITNNQGGLKQHRGGHLPLIGCSTVCFLDRWPHTICFWHLFWHFWHLFLIQCFMLFHMVVSVLFSCSKCMVLIWHHFANSFYLIFIILRWNYTFWWKDHVKKATTKAKSKAPMLYNLQPLKKSLIFPNEWF